MKKIAVMLLTMVLVLSLVSPTLAQGPAVNARVTSLEFPDAYILTEMVDSKQIKISPDGEKISITGVSDETQDYMRDVIIDNPELRNTLITNKGQIARIVSATVFVEEEYKVVGDDVVITNSRLLSQEEVEAIGISNFTDLASQKVEISPQSVAGNSRGKLSITFTCNTLSDSNYAAKYQLKGKASWSGFDTVYNSTNNPAVGEDFFGFAWGGDLTSTSPSASATWNGGGSQSIYMSDAAANAGTVWSFEEFRGGAYMIYVSPANIGLTIQKKVLTGNGNTTQAILKYIHTYQTVSGSISITANSSGVGSGFTLSSTSKQWSIVCTMSNIAY